MSTHDAPTVAFLRAGSLVTGVLALAGGLALTALRGPATGASLLLGVAIPVVIVTLGVLAVSSVARAAPGQSLLAAAGAFLFTVLTIPTLAYAAIKAPWVERGTVGAGITAGVLVWQAAATVGWYRARHAVLEEGPR